MHPDGTGSCDRCDVHLEGFGVLSGMVVTDLSDTTSVQQTIFCYVNGCRDFLLDGMVLFTDDPALCTECGFPTPRSVGAALLATDLDPVTGEPRYLLFCRSDGSRDRLLERLL